MSDTKYVSNVDKNKNRSARKYHEDPDCHALADDYREMREHDERLFLSGCTYCVKGYRPSELINHDHD